MKNSYKILAVTLASLAVTSCADLDTEYLGSMVTSEQKEQVLESKPDMALASVTGCFAAFLTSDFDASNVHYEYGYTSLMLGMDSQTADLVGKYIGYNWYNSFEAYSDRNDTGGGTVLAWDNAYKQIYACNTLVGTISPDTDNKELMFYRAQGLGLRAFNYWTLANLYQFNYTVNAQAPCVPLITEENQQQAVLDGMPRATVEEVFTKIITDLNETVTLLENSGVDPSKVIDSKPKRLITLATAYGLRARAYLTMHKYAEAAADAKAAISNFAGSPYTIAEVSKPTMTDISDHAWMWGVAVSEQDRVITSGIVNWPSHMGSFSYGYVTVGAWRWCSVSLYNSIPKTDVRKGWWLDENYSSPNLTAAQASYLMDFCDPTVGKNWNDGTGAIMPYTQVKFDSYKGVLGQSTPAQDIPLMRIEEMYLTLAEATGMSTGYANGVTLLNDFVRTYRDPSYACKATDNETFQDECWRQRRIELWGEGLAWYDVMRLNKPIDRVGCGFPSALVYQIPAGSDALLYCIPLDEVNANKQLSSADNNKNADRPTPVQDIAY